MHGVGKQEGRRIENWRTEHELAAETGERCSEEMIKYCLHGKEARVGEPAWLNQVVSTGILLKWYCLPFADSMRGWELDHCVLDA